MNEEQLNKKPLFDTDFNKELYRIEIIACKGGNKWTISKIDNNPHPSFHEVIGTLEIVKQRTIWEQMKANETLAQEHLKSEENKEL